MNDMNEFDKKKLAVFPNMFLKKSDRLVCYAMIFTGTDDNLNALKMAFGNSIDYSELKKDDIVILTPTETKIISFRKLVKN